MTNYVDVTEISGDEVSQEQVERMCQRYFWAGEFCRGKDVLEAGCGAGQGLGYIAGLARSLVGGDYSQDIIEMAQRHYGERIALRKFDAQDMPFEDNSFDVVILFEAIYYLPSAERFVEECKRVLRPHGKVLISSANKDLYDHNPSPHAHADYGVKELFEMFSAKGWSNLRQHACGSKRLLRPVKKAAVALDLMPKTIECFGGSTALLKEWIEFPCARGSCGRSRKPPSPST